MKCPKCEYLGFDTGTRCRNCGYDFSLIGKPAAAPDLQLRDADRQTPDSTAWLDHFTLDTADPSPTRSVDAVPEERPAAAAAGMAAGGTGVVASRQRAAGAPLPLFAPGVDDDEPLIKLPAAPRAPLSVRRTPDAPRLRAVTRAAPRRIEAEPEPSLDFPEDAGVAVAEEPAAAPERATTGRQRGVTVPRGVGEPGGSGPRLLAALLDHGVLLAIDAAVLYFTLRVAGLSAVDWALLPPIPLVFFLGLIKVGYFAAFTAIGGQTLGKMAAGIAVVSDSGQPLDPAGAITRAIVGAVSLLVGGLGFVPALVAADRRALHDRVAGTRVIVRPS
jgi:uncharacterized RDD family membrane protein YckC